MGCPHGEWEGPCGQCDFEAGKVGDPRDADLARLKAEVGSKNATIEATRRHVDRLRRALAAGPAAVRRQENVDVNTREAYARVVEVAQAEAMKEKP